MSEELNGRIRKVLSEVQELLGKDGAKLDLVEITPDHVVRVRLSGTCATCRPAELPTLRAGIERLLKAEVGEVAGVETV
ncbi:MAG TPA: NifU family protein [bacterium]|nr:NifU family protein [bacterium]